MAGKSETTPPPHPHVSRPFYPTPPSLSQLTFRHFHEFQTYYGTAYEFTAAVLWIPIHLIRIPASRHRPGLLTNEHFKNNSFLHLLMFFFTDLNKWIESSKKSTPEKNKIFLPFF
jgi:hypothetical protein